MSEIVQIGLNYSTPSPPGQVEKTVPEIYKAHAGKIVWFCSNWAVWSKIVRICSFWSKFVQIGLG